MTTRYKIYDASNETLKKELAEQKRLVDELREENRKLRTEFDAMKQLKALNQGIYMIDRSYFIKKLLIMEILILWSGCLFY